MKKLLLFLVAIGLVGCEGLPVLDSGPTERPVDVQLEQMIEENAEAAAAAEEEGEAGEEATEGDDTEEAEELNTEIGADAEAQATSDDIANELQDQPIIVIE